jgi:hypothetical protein
MPPLRLGVRLFRSLMEQAQRAALHQQRREAGEEESGRDAQTL